MRPFTWTAALALLVSSVLASPITPSAPELQRRAEVYRLQGLKEHEIASRLTLPADADIDTDKDTEADDEDAEEESASAPFLSRMSTRLRTLISSPSASADYDYDDTHDLSGDIAPGSLEAPQMLPRAAEPESLADSLYERINAVFHAEDAERRNFGYEGKELELRRPEGMRFWGS